MRFPFFLKEHKFYHHIISIIFFGLIFVNIFLGIKPIFCSDNDINLELNTARTLKLQKYKTGQILVKAVSDLSEDEFDGIVKKNQAKIIEKIGKKGVHILSVPKNSEDSIIKTLLKNPKIEFAELDKAIKFDSVFVNDPKIINQWHLSKINAPIAWEDSTGTGIVIAILDSGVDSNHPDLINQVLPGWNSINLNTDSADINGHGTAVAGSAIATTNNALGIAGLAYNAKILPIRITNDSTGWAYFSDIARGLYWAADNGADVANISYIATTSSTITSAAQYMNSKGGVVVSSAGNDSSDLLISDNPYIITVSATTNTDTRASWSNYGSCVDVAAPGTYIYTTNKGGSYGSWNGTSFSSPITAGIIALIMSANHNLKPGDVEYILESTAIKLSSSDFDPYFGHGRVDAAAAINLALNTESSDTQAPIVNITSPINGETLSGSITVNVNVTDNIGVKSVSLFANNILIGTDSTNPYQFNINTLNYSDGDLILNASASDDMNNIGNSQKIIVKIKNQEELIDNEIPNIVIKTPLDNSVVKKSVTISAIASDNIGISKMELFIDGKLILTSTSSLIKYNWNTNKISSGYHIINVIATDTSGNINNNSIQVKK